MLCTCSALPPLHSQACTFLICLPSTRGCSECSPAVMLSIALACARSSGRARSHLSAPARRDSVADARLRCFLSLVFWCVRPIKRFTHLINARPVCRHPSNSHWHQAAFAPPSLPPRAVSPFPWPGNRLITTPLSATSAQLDVCKISIWHGSASCHTATPLNVLTYYASKAHRPQNAFQACISEQVFPWPQAQA